MVLVGFAVQFAGVFGGYIAAAQTALLLSFVLAVSVPAPAAAVGPRLAGWLVAGLIATLSGVFLWPRFERLHLRRTAAEACRALARLVRAQRRGAGPEGADVELAHHQAAARVAVEAVRHQYTATPKRPAGPTRRDRAFVELLTELERFLDVAGRPFRLQPGSAHPWMMWPGARDPSIASCAAAISSSVAVQPFADGPEDGRRRHHARTAARAAARAAREAAILAGAHYRRDVAAAGSWDEAAHHPHAGGRNAGVSCHSDDESVSQPICHLADARLRAGCASYLEDHVLAEKEERTDGTP
jgi:uncharacterized membrane protein YccC